MFHIAVSAILLRGILIPSEYVQFRIILSHYKSEPRSISTFIIFLSKLHPNISLNHVLSNA